MDGKIHSFQSMGAVDGPGLRFVVFLQGCPLRCMYCHNPDTWTTEGGTVYSVDDIVTRVLRYRTYFGDNGGVTVSGGEALLQATFVAELFEALHSHGIHTCLDTSGIGCYDEALLRRLLSATDLVLCDIKFTTEDSYRKLCGGSLKAVQHFLDVCGCLQVPIWVRHVVVPGFTDTEESVLEMLKLATAYPYLKRVELLPFHKLCEAKYEELGILFPCHDVPACTNEQLLPLKALIPEQLQ